MVVKQQPLAGWMLIIQKGVVMHTMAGTGRAQQRYVWQLVAKKATSA